MRTHMKMSIGMALVAGATAVTASCFDRAEPTRPQVQSSHVHVAASRASAPALDLGDKLAELRRATVR